MVTMSQKEFQRVKVIENAVGGRLSVGEASRLPPSPEAVDLDPGSRQVPGLQRFASGGKTSRRGKHLRQPRDGAPPLARRQTGFSAAAPARWNPSFSASIPPTRSPSPPPPRFSPPSALPPRSCPRAAPPASTPARSCATNNEFAVVGHAFLACQRPPGGTQAKHLARQGSHRTSSAVVFKPGPGSHRRSARLSPTLYRTLRSAGCTGEPVRDKRRRTR